MAGKPPADGTRLRLGAAFLIALCAHGLALPWLVQGAPTPELPAALTLAELNAPPVFVTDSPLPIELAMKSHPERMDVQVRLHLSRDAVISPDDLDLIDVPQQTTAQTLTVQFSPEVGADAGRWWLIAEASSAAHDLRDTAARPVVVEPIARPDLTVDRIDAPAEALSGGVIDVCFRVANLTDGYAWQTWKDRLVLSQDQTLSEDDVTLTALPRSRELLGAEAYVQDAAGIALPGGLSGTWHLIVLTDAQQAVDEAGRKTNNTLAVPIELSELQAVDLKPVTLITPDYVVPGETMRLTWEVLNQGNVETAEPAWRDAVYLSQDETLSDDDTALLGVEVTEAVGPGQAYRIEGQTVQLPTETSYGLWYLIVAADRSEAVSQELDRSNNTLAVPIDVVTPEEAEALQPVIGDPEDFTEASTVAWISYQDYQLLVARESPYLQPAVQRLADPTDAAPPLPTAPREQSSQEQVAGAQPSAPPASRDALPDQAIALLDPQAEVAGPAGGLAEPQAEASAGDEAGPVTPITEAPPGPAVQGEGQGQTPTPGPSDAAEAREAETDEPTEDETPPAETEPDVIDQPTSAPRDDFESIPVVRIVEPFPVTSGEVLTREGLRVRPESPNISRTTWLTSRPERNPSVLITFDQTGRVVETELVTSSGRPEYDGPVRESAWRYRASGPQIDTLGERRLQITVRLIFLQE